MVTKKLTLLLMLWPFLMWSQTDLVKWYNADFTPSLIENHITASNITSSGVTLINESWGTDNVFYSFNGSSSTSIDTSKYVQFAVSPDAGYKIVFNSFSFNSRSQGNGKKEVQNYQVRYSKDANFSSYTPSKVEFTNSSNYTTNTIDLGKAVVSSGETLYIRIYSYNTNNNFHIEHNNSGTVAPIINGTVSLITPIAVVANDDKAGLVKNTSSTINVLSNDDYKYTSPVTAINITKQPDNGAVSVDGITGKVIYTPVKNYVGYDDFRYTVTNAVGVSNTAIVQFQVIDNTGTGAEQVLARWRSNDNLPNPTNYVTSVSGFKASSSEMNVWASSDGTYDVYFLGGLPSPQVNNGTLKETNYLQFAIKAGNSNDFNAFLKKFKFEYRSQGGDNSGNLTVKYSKDPSFNNNVNTFTSANNISYSGNWTQVSLDFAPEVSFLYPGDTMYVRLYAYNTNNIFMIKYKSNLEIGPAIIGNVSPYYPAPCSVSAVWNGKGWVNNVKPDINKRAIINADYDTSVNGSFEACSIQVNKGKLSIAKDKYIKVNKTIETTNGGSIEVQSDGNLFQLDGSIINSSAIKVLRAASLKYKDYNYWGSPVKGQNLKAFSPNTPNSKFLVYNELKNSFNAIDPISNDFVPGMGYAIRAEDTLPAGNLSKVTEVYTGIPNNGDIYVSVKKSSTSYGYNLVGNPYPSDISFEDFYKENKDKINGIAYLWTNINPNPAMQGSAYPGKGYINNYAILNLSGGVPAASPVCSSDGQKCSETPTNIMRVGQGFIVKSILPDTNQLVFKNTMRKTDVNAKFFNRVAAKANSNQVDRFWLQLTTPLDVTNKILIAYKEDATDDFEIDYDAPHMVIGSDSFYSILSDTKLAIQGRHYPLLKSDVVPLGASFYGDGTYTISISEKEGIFANGQSVYLKDKVTGVITNLSEKSYSFSAVAGQDNNRFEIVYVNPGSTLGTDNNIKNLLVVYQADGFIKVESPENMNKIILYDMAGKMVYQNNVSGKFTQISTERFTTGVYVVNILTVNGKTTKKIIIR